ncbi:hypothetical protein LMG9964_03263 [Paraburkholderia phenoliruptrix]|uniref:Uncharacterized protein n=1 Tax=Paraburkholderia phenoliruptrix TaxID=252970 RepID=A0A6J5K5B3_9BURK|nr:hypothetical protein LMG9964_03263 [Paraburkholderia phenoliruptrix]
MDGPVCMPGSPRVQSLLREVCATGDGLNLPAAPSARYAKSFKRHFEYLERTRRRPSYGAMHKTPEKQMLAADRSHDTGRRGVTKAPRCAAHHSRALRVSTTPPGTMECIDG